MNMTDFFEEASGLPKSSESFWTCLFALYLLHLGKTKGSIKVWERLDSNKAPYYGRRKGSPWFDLSGLRFEDVTVEPKTLARHLKLVAKLSAEEAGFEPDVVLVRPSSSLSKRRYVFIENKITQKLQPNQIENYPKLIGSLNKKGIEAEFLLLMSIGSNEVDNQARGALKTQLGPRLGLLLWEDVICEMGRGGFVLPGIDFLQFEKFTRDLDADAAWGNHTTV